MKFRSLTGSHAGRLVLAAVPVAVVSSLLMAGVANGAVPVSFAVSGSQFQISASTLDGTGFSQYAGVAPDTAGKQHQVAIANIKSATLADLCQSVVTDTPLGKVGMLITAGGGGVPGERERPPDRDDRPEGRLDVQQHPDRRGRIHGQHDGQRARPATSHRMRTRSRSRGLQQTAWSTQASVFTLTGMHVQLTDGSKGCF